MHGAAVGAEKSPARRALVLGVGDPVGVGGVWRAQSEVIRAIMSDDSPCVPHGQETMGVGGVWRVYQSCREERRAGREKEEPLAPCPRSEMEQQLHTIRGD